MLHVHLDPSTSTLWHCRIDTRLTEKERKCQTAIFVTEIKKNYFKSDTAEKETEHHATATEV
jgi:hypothetical protein